MLKLQLPTIYKDEQRLASARLGVVFMVPHYFLQFFRCESALPANFFVVALVRPSLRALLEMVPTCFDVVRQDFEHATVAHLLSLRRYRVGMKFLVVASFYWALYS